MPVEALLPEGLLKQQKERVGKEAGGEGEGLHTSPDHFIFTCIRYKDSEAQDIH